MRLNSDLAATLFHGDTHIVHMGCLMFRLRCIAHRMLNFGFEPFVNGYSARELLLLATIMPQRAHDALIREAHQRGDATLRALVEQHCAEILNAGWKREAHGTL